VLSVLQNVIDKRLFYSLNFSDYISVTSGSTYIKPTWK